jgi:hypothetical protein
MAATTIRFQIRMEDNWVHTLAGFLRSAANLGLQVRCPLMVGPVELWQKVEVTCYTEEDEDLAQIAALNNGLQSAD